APVRDDRRVRPARPASDEGGFPRHPQIALSAELVISLTSRSAEQPPVCITMPRQQNTGRSAYSPLMDATRPGRRGFPTFSRARARVASENRPGRAGGLPVALGVVLAVLGAARGTAR